MIVSMIVRAWYPVLMAWTCGPELKVETFVKLSESICNICF